MVGRFHLDSGQRYQNILRRYLIKRRRDIVKVVQTKQDSPDLNGYDVVLYGQVVEASLKNDAAHLKIEGAEGVENWIEVLPTSGNDDRLRRDLFIAIYRYGPLQHYGVGSNRPIRIIVNHGNVTLEGVVDRESDKNLAVIRANGVPGVFSVKNNLVVPGKAK
jgi:osmotically-inducible protein OsmY